MISNINKKLVVSQIYLNISGSKLLFQFFYFKMSCLTQCVTCRFFVVSFEIH